MTELVFESLFYNIAPRHLTISLNRRELTFISETTALEDHSVENSDFHIHIFVFKSFTDVEQSAHLANQQPMSFLV